MILRVRSRLGKYRIDKRLAEGGFAVVYKARDTVSGVSVALKIPNKGMIDAGWMETFRKEVRLTARLDHPNVLPIKDAGTIDGVFYVASPLGIETLGDRMARRMSSKQMLEFASQMLDAVAYAHGKRIMHCDIKPENFILFPDQRLRLADFGIAKLALRTMPASGSGTVGYIAPEQAMGKPSFRSDVFSLGLVLYRMFSGYLPQWPFRWPFAGWDRIRRNLHPDLIALLKRSIEVDSTRRYADALAMRRAFMRVKPRAFRRAAGRRASRAIPQVSWRTVRFREFNKRFRRVLDIRETCPRCSGPMSELMNACPWCGTSRRRHKEPTPFPARCPRCLHGVKADWRFCPWCYGAAIHPEGGYRYSDARYRARCSNPRCVDKVLMPFMRYCPWCRRKVARRWSIEGSKDRCPNCRWGVVRDYWDFCPWCEQRVTGRS